MEDQGSAAAKRTNVLAAQRASLLAAVLQLSGELGYRQASVERIAARSGYSVGQFYAHFASREEAFAAAYQAKADELIACLLKARREAPDWPAGIRAALRELTGFATSEPTLASALLAEVYVAGGASLTSHQQNLRRLSDAVAGTRRESHPSRHDPPPITATFIVGALEEAVRRRLAEGRAELLWDDLPELVALAVGAYIGDEAAVAERRHRPDRSRST